MSHNNFDYVLIKEKTEARLYYKGELIEKCRADQCFQIVSDYIRNPEIRLSNIYVRTSKKRYMIREQ